jgi:tRNA-binding EMAP/Myf-like protein
MDEINYDDFRKIDIRMGTVVEATVPEWSHWVLKMKVNLGEEIGEKVCFSGIMKFFKPEDLVGKQFPFVINLKPKNVGPDREPSEVMMIMAVPKEDPLRPESEASETIPTVLLNPTEKVEDGTPVL